jgi:hypothetical protein
MSRGSPPVAVLNVLDVPRLAARERRVAELEPASAGTGPRANL